MDTQTPPEKKSNKTVLIIIIALAVVISAGVAIYFTTQNKNVNAGPTESDAADSTDATNTAADPYASLKRYDGKVIDITSADGKVTGKVAIAFRMSEQMPIQVVYFLKVTDTLPKTTGPTGGASYHYISNHAAADDIRNGDGTGNLDPIFCHTDQMPDVLSLAQIGSIDASGTYTGCSAQYDPQATATTFYLVYSDYHNNYDFNYDAIVGRDTLAVFDSGPYATTDAATGYSTMDYSQAVSQGTLAAQYTLTYSD